MRLKIRNDHLGGHAAHVETDGVRRDDVLAIELRMYGDKPTTATLTYLVDELDVDVVTVLESRES